MIYLYGDTDPNYRRNFEFFLEHGMESAGGLVDYVIIVQQVLTEQAATLVTHAGTALLVLGL